ncbi:hypothetical protein [Indibacter alkaliphilus]|nr:hypothetical protein [Indibacter alkaliphilus]
MSKEKMAGNFKRFLSKIKTSFKIIALFHLLVVSGCEIQDVERPPLQLINNILVNGQRIEFRSVKFSLTGPVSISNENSHVLALLELSTSEEFEDEPPTGSSLYAIPIYAVNQGINLPEFPIQNGTFEVVSEEILEGADQDELDGKNFSTPIKIFLSANNSGSWTDVIEGVSGTIQLQFDLTNNLVRISNTYETKEGQQVSGAVALPLDLSSFRQF